MSAKQQLKSSGSVYTSAIIDVTPEMLPSFRIVAFYLLPRGMSQNPELVADSIWIDVNDRCMGTVSQTLCRCTSSSSEGVCTSSEAPSLGGGRREGEDEMWP